MTTLKDIKIMNDTLINYYQNPDSKNEKKLLKHKIIQEILNIENCFNKMSKENAIKILKDIGISENNIDIVYYDIIKNN